MFVKGSCGGHLHHVVRVSAMCSDSQAAVQDVSGLWVGVPTSQLNTQNLNERRTVIMNCWVLDPAVIFSGSVPTTSIHPFGGASA
jgi:hypothetical protein